MEPETSCWLVAHKQLYGPELMTDCSTGQKLKKKMVVKSSKCIKWDICIRESKKMNFKSRKTF